MPYKNILHIDDDEEDQEIFFSAVTQISASVNCKALSDATDAFQKLQKKEIVPDVIFLDLNMPVMNGQQFLVEIKKNSSLKNIPVIIFSTSSHTGTIHLMKELGASDFITKPAGYDQLLNLLRPLLT